ncbi:hypothetical protein BKG78_17490 [Mycobacteroides chelonae]|nr:hypothetical protein BKG78_17490 [Mycobacteroides chelonae]
MIGTNRGDRAAARTLVRERGAQPVDWSGWRAIDTDAQAGGVAAGRPRQKFVRTADILTAAGGQEPITRTL